MSDVGISSRHCSESIALQQQNIATIPLIVINWVYPTTAKKYFYKLYISHLLVDLHSNLLDVKCCTMAIIPIIVISHVYPIPPTSSFADPSGPSLNFFLFRLVKNHDRPTGLKKGAKNQPTTSNSQEIFPVNGAGALIIGIKYLLKLSAKALCHLTLWW